MNKLPLRMKILGIDSGTSAAVALIDTTTNTNQIFDTPVASGKIISAGRTVINQGQAAVPEGLKSPHVANNSGNNEWVTPPHIIKAVTDVLGQIDVDPASSEEANKIVKAATFYTIENDGLKQPWSGRVFLNPPYSSKLVSKFCDLLVEKYYSGEVREAVALINNTTETSYFQNLLSVANSVCFPKGRIKFLNSAGKVVGTPLQGQALIYFGANRNKFVDVFSSLGKILLTGHHSANS